MARKTEIYTWRVSSATKASLEEAARTASRSVAHVLNEIVAEHFAAASPASESDIALQRRLHARAHRFAGCLTGGVPRRSEHVRALVRTRLERRRARAR